MDIDPLSDTVPSRYAVESDEEDEFNPLVPQRPAKQATTISIQLQGNVSQSGPVIIAIGDAGNSWACGALLGEPSGVVTVNGLQAGSLFTPAWMTGTVLVSEVTTRLPIWAMHRYAHWILSTLKPSKVSILDTYPVPSYISSHPTSVYDAPVRYLCTAGRLPQGAFQPFDPPNMIQSTSASFMSILSIQKVDGTLLLLPSFHVPAPHPAECSQYHLPTSNLSTRWPAHLLQIVQEQLTESVGEECQMQWHPTAGSEKLTQVAAKRRGDVGEGGMYI
ncbi:hypothetical protein JAAARDRAFT_162445 [Jaapia argillacea MUCL 33604]|uniref:Proteasome assembly chaperone 1 n=1 Tax=Jaapia argillacea MUCL 33604 TaxID=933084 RepID=A0A067PRJ1_9AGAM|nr:hypothetical protein JAAARDRAFT_162445 [Jaapia argillacea MUCL 33604]